MARPSTETEGSYRMPSYEHATAADAMRPGVISCPPETSLRVVARMMAREHIHSVVVETDDGWQVVTDVDLLRAAEGDLDRTTAGQIAGSDLPSVSPEETLVHAGQVMAEHEVNHVLVVNPGATRPAGVLSTLDLAGVLAWGRA